MIAFHSHTELRNFTGSVEEYQKLYNQKRKEWINENKIRALQLPAWERKKVFGDLLKELDVHVTEKRYL
ncbi:MAG TPA: hypothetical protein VI911_10890 [Patescibacteria group bacterium]|nr:hypothetical protein [Patescibacteria group bacterium]